MHSVPILSLFGGGVTTSAQVSPNSLALHAAPMPKHQPRLVLVPEYECDAW